MHHLDLTNISQTPPFSFLSEQKMSDLQSHFQEAKGKKG